MAGGSLAQFGDVIHPEAVNREAVNEPAACRGSGPGAFHATSQWLTSAFDELAFSVLDVVRQDDVVVVHCTMSGRQTGDFVVHAADGSVERVFVPTGRLFAVRQAHFHRVRDGQVVEHRAVRDDQGMALQLGWVPPSPWFLVRCALATSRARRATPA
jgi:predicted ester cyclase